MLCAVGFGTYGFNADRLMRGDGSLKPKLNSLYGFQIGGTKVKMLHLLKPHGQ
jgi:hypothetical protein